MSGCHLDLHHFLTGSTFERLNLFSVKVRFCRILLDSTCIAPYIPDTDAHEYDKAKNTVTKTGEHLHACNFLGDTNSKWVDGCSGKSDCDTEVNDTAADDGIVSECHGDGDKHRNQSVSLFKHSHGGTEQSE